MAGSEQEERAQRQIRARALRLEGLTNTKIAAQMGVSVGTIGRYMRGVPMTSSRSTSGRAQAMNNVNDAARAQNTERAFALRLQGMGKAAIAREMGVSNASVVRWLQEEIESRVAPKVAEYRELENSRLDYYLTKLAPAIEAGDVKAIGLAVHISQRRAGLNGLDAPIRFDVHSAGPTDADRQVQTLIEEVERRNRVVEAEIVGEVTTTDVVVIQ